MLQNDINESWRKIGLKKSWILGSGFVKISDERKIEMHDILDYLMKHMTVFLIN